TFSIIFISFAEKAHNLPFSNGKAQTRITISEPEIAFSENKKRPLDVLKIPLKKLPLKPKLAKDEPEEYEEKIDLEELDWWSKYYASLEEMTEKEHDDEEEANEQEKQYNNFEDWLYIFPLFRGKANEGELGDKVDDRTTGKYK
ncbi:hypothetical protein scyTo_0019986, partial [Scyliorhinus torazame]|nr:hypothetical protein [Scyliorhinus torazame]